MIRFPRSLLNTLKEFDLKPEQAVIMLVEYNNEVKECELSAVEAQEDLGLKEKAA